MNRIDRYNAFDFNDNKIIDDEINTIAKVDSLPVINDWQTDLATDPQTLLTKFVN